LKSGRLDLCPALQGGFRELGSVVRGQVRVAFSPLSEMLSRFRIYSMTEYARMRFVLREVR